MALTSMTIFDIADQTQSITFYQSGTQVDMISYASNQITYSAISSYSLQKTDFALYMQYLRIFYNFLLSNFPGIATYFPTAWPSPGTSMSITQTYPPLRIVFNHTSAGTLALNMSYLPLATACTYTARASPVTITLQELAASIDMMNQFAVQMNAN